MIDIVYAVGSLEKNFVVDKIYTDEGKAVEYCDKRRNTKYVWVVMRAPIGRDWLSWVVVHRTPRKS